MKIKNRHFIQPIKYSLFYRYLITTILFLFFPVIIIGMIIINQTYIQLSSDVATSCNESVTRISNQLLSYMDSMRDTAQIISTDSKLRTDIINQGAYQQIEAVDVLEYYGRMIPFAQECGIYYKDDHSVYTSEGKYSMSFYFKNQYGIDINNEFEEKNLIPQKEQIISNFSESEGNTLFIFYPIKISGYSSPNAVVFYRISSISFLNGFRNLIIPDSQQLLLFQNQKDLIFRSNEDFPSLPHSYEQLAKWDLQKNQYYVSNQTLEKRNIQIFLITEYSQYQYRFDKLRHTLTAFGVIVCLLCIILIFITTYLNYIPVQTFVRKITLANKEKMNTSTKSNAPNELETALNIFKKIDLENALLSDQVQEQSIVITSQLFKMFLEGVNVSEKALNRVIGDSSFDSAFCMVIPGNLINKNKNIFISAVEENFKDIFIVEQEYEDLIVIIFKSSTNENYEKLKIAKK